MFRRIASSVTGSALLLSAPLWAGEKPKEGFFKASDGVKIHYLEIGQGTPVVLIHGYTGFAEGNWFTNGIAEALAAKHRVIAPDVRGHGLSDKPHDPAMYGPRLWQDVIELMDYLGVKQAHVHGYSMGGAIVTQLLAHHPERFLTAVYGGSGVRENDPLWTAKVPKDKEGVDPKEAEAMAKLRNAPHRDAKALEAVRQGLVPALRSRIELTKVTIPVLAINGEFDSPNAKTHRMQRELKDFRSVVLPGKSHLTAIMAGYMPDLYVQTLVDFIDSHDGKP